MAVKKQQVRSQIDWRFPAKGDEKGYVLVDLSSGEVLSEKVKPATGVAFEKEVAKALKCTHAKLAETVGSRRIACVHRHFWQTFTAKREEEPAS